MPAPGPPRNPSPLTPNLVIPRATAAEAGSYDCIVNGLAGMIVSDPAVLTVNKAPATINLGGLLVTYDGSPKSAGAATNPSGLTTVVTYDGIAAAPVNAGSYAVLATISDANYEGSATGTLVINKAAGTVTLADLTHTYDGTPKVATAVTTPVGLAVVITYDGSSTPPRLPGSHPVEARIDDPNYDGAAVDTLEIGITALVRRGLSLNGAIDGSIQLLTAEPSTLNGTAWISGDLLVPGTPELRANGNPTIVGITDEAGAADPANYWVTLNGNSLLRYFVRRVDAIDLPVVATPPAPAGSRNVSLNKTTDPVGDWSTLRNLTLNGNGITLAVPAGTYGNLTANGSNRFVLGVAGATEPAIYNLQALTLNGTSRLDVVGPVVLTLASGPNLNSSAGHADHPDWLVLRVANGGVTLNGKVTLHARVEAPGGTVTINGSSTLTGSVAADRLIVNGNGALEGPKP